MSEMDEGCEDENLMHIDKSENDDDDKMGDVNWGNGEEEDDSTEVPKNEANVNNSSPDNDTQSKKPNEDLNLFATVEEEIKVENLKEIKEEVKEGKMEEVKIKNEVEFTTDSIKAEGDNLGSHDISFTNPINNDNEAIVQYSKSKLIPNTAKDKSGIIQPSKSKLHTIEHTGESSTVLKNANLGQVNKINENESLSSISKAPAVSLPLCKVKRSYVCGYCNMKTTNPREYLYHLRDTHGDIIRIYECSYCIYASKTHQKLVRHTDMVHKIKLGPETDIFKKPRAKVPPLMSRSPRESKSPRRFEEYDFSEDFVEKYLESRAVANKVNETQPVKKPKVHRCSECTFQTSYLQVLAKHEFKFHSKQKVKFSCQKCHYSTHVKSRLSKHQKYHELPILTCEWCDFRTPYKWNMDRHYRNHTEDCGEFRCHLCNFTAQIKQSLTAHVTNHHLSPEQIESRERTRTQGISDMEDEIAEDEMELLRMEREEDLEALEIPTNTRDSIPNHFTVSKICVGNQDNESYPNDNEELENGEPTRKKPKIKITFTKLKPSIKDNSQESKELQNEDETFIRPDVVTRNGNVYVKTEKCSLCPYKAPFLCEVQRHKKNVHGIHSLKETPGVRNLKKQKSFEKLENFEKNFNVKNLKSAAKLPEIDSEDNDILTSDEINARHDSDEGNLYDESDEVNVCGYSDDEDSNSEQTSKKNDDLKQDEASNKESLLKKKSSSFFDKLQEKLSMSNVQNLVCQFCGHESKCLSESVRHQKLHLSAKNIFASASLSTRCQFCRHRCKTTDDLMNHLKSCPEARKNQISDNKKNTSDDASDQSESCEGKKSVGSEDTEVKKHPMINKVFVWNNISNNSDNDEVPSANDLSADDRSRSPYDENVDSDDEAIEDYVNALKSTTTQVYRCPQCSFRSTTASRFHVHMVGHYNKKPYSCSICFYRSNWRWDITKHIKLKVPRDEIHKKAIVCLSDETLIEKNYEKYDQYLTEVSRDEIHHSEGGFSMSRKGNHLRSLTETDSTGTDSAKSSPCPTPVPNGSSATRIPAPPKLTRAPNRQSSVGPNPIGPILPGVQTMTEKITQKPPPLLAMGALAQSPQQLSKSTANPTATELATDSTDNKVETNNGDDDAANTSSNANYQIITPQGAMNTSLETLQLLASGSTNLARLKRQQKETGVGNDPELDAAVTNQMRLLLWLNCLVGGTKELKEGEAAKATENPPGNTRTNQGEQNLSNIMKLVLDHEGNPEWKCSTCDFRDNEQETVVQHVRLAHGKKGPVSLVHAVHRCSVCGYAAGTKRHVQVHIENDHNGQGGIISRSEGQNVDPGENGSNDAPHTFECRLCPFNCKKKMELKVHICHHTPRADYIFKCMFCPFYVATKNELFAHLSVHGMDIPSTKDSTSSNGHEPANNQQNSEAMDDNASRQFTCDLCPFETRSRAKLMHHRQFHRPRGLPFSCPHCSYNVTRRHLLAQHLRIHGVSPTEGMDGDGAPEKHNLSKVFSDDSRMARKSPSPSLTITPINSSTQLTNGAVPTSNIDPECLPTLSNDLTKNLPDIPLVWVSRDSRFFKMFKCRHCPHVNLRKTNIQEHEKMHRTDGLGPGVGHACQFCSYTCINAGVMSAHVKVHSGSMGKCHALVDPALANEEQLRMLAGSSSQKSISDKTIKKGDEKLVYYCQHCPARFFFEKEVHIHSRSHNSNVKFIHLCSNCNFGSREESQVLAHAKVHTPEYQERTRTLMSMHPSAPAFPPVANLSVPGDVSKPTFGVPMEDSDMGRAAKCSQLNGISRPWLVSSPPISSQATTANNMPQPPPTSRFKCDQCPSTFSKQITLQYHQSLHSADNPFRCNRCTYAAKTHDGLQQHVALHDQADLEKSTANSVLSSAASSPAPSPSPSLSPQKTLENSTDSFGSNKFKSTSLDQPPIKLKFIGLKGSGTSTSKSTKKQQFKYYIEEQVPLSGVELLKRKHQIEREMPKDAYLTKKENPVNKSRISRPEDKSGNPTLHYPLHIDKSSGRSREKRYKCSKCPSAFEKLDQFNVHINLHGSNYKYRCKICDYSVKFYANFMMHMKRHKYNAIMDAQRKGQAPPAEDDTIFEPYVGDNPITEERVPAHNIQDEVIQDKENHFDFAACPEMTTAEKQQIILQQKKADAFLPKDEDKDKRIFYCQYCPYANLRRDAVDSHSLRHQANYGKGQYQCNFCDYCASGPNFIREHTKVHFRSFKYVVPEGFMKHDKLEIWSIKSGEANDNDDTPKKSLFFAHEDGTFTPKAEEFVNDSQTTESSKSVDMDDDPNMENGILVDYRSGDVVDAPNNFILPLRPTKTNRSTAPNPVAKSLKSYSKSRRARKHAKLKSSAVISDASHVFVNGSSSTEAAEEDFQEASVTIDEGSDLDLQQSTTEPMCEDPLDISNHSENINENSIDATEEIESTQEDQDYDMVEDSCGNDEEANISEMECIPAV